MGVKSDAAAPSTGQHVDPAWLEPTWFIDSDHPAVTEFARRAVSEWAGSTGSGAAANPTEIAVALFHAVRDGIRYDPWASGRDPERYKASAVATSTANWCVPKSVLLTAAARNQGIPARLGFADVRNHLTSEKLAQSMGTDVFMWHGYSELLLPRTGGPADHRPPGPGPGPDPDRRWFKLSSAFNIELCERFGVKVLEFDGTDDALFHPFDEAGNRHMEYVDQRGSFDDLPLDQIHADFDRYYGGMVGRLDGDGVDEAFQA